MKDGSVPFSAMEGSMHIIDSSVQLTSSRHSYEEYRREETLRINSGAASQARSDDDTRNNQKSISNIPRFQAGDTFQLSSEGIDKSARIRSDDLEEQEVMGDLNIRILRDIIERITGKKVHIFKLKHDADAAGDHPQTAQSGDAQQPVDRGGVEYTLHESYREGEETQFHAEGKFSTANGKDIQFSVDLHMQREFSSQTTIRIVNGERVQDPLVVNFSGQAVSLSEQKFAFDIDSDSVLENISFVSSGSGMLAYDRNNDALINDGPELFGPTSGNGFAELAQFDDDGNRWIDEKDTIFDQLRIWVKSEDGRDSLYTLDEKGVGAIFLGHADTSFELKDGSNQKHGQVQSSGVFVKDDYTVGTVQQVDLVV